MFIGLQIVGLCFGLFMLYFTNLYYKRKEFSLTDLGLWGILWVMFIIAVLFPQSLNIFMQTLGVNGAMSFFTVVGFMFMFLLVFFMYKSIKKTQKRTEHIVRYIALQNKK